MKFLKNKESSKIEDTISAIYEKQLQMEKLILEVSEKDTPVNYLENKLQINNEIIDKILQQLIDISDKLDELNKPWYSRIFCP